LRSGKRVWEELRLSPPVSEQSASVLEAKSIFIDIQVECTVNSI